MSTTLPPVDPFAQALAGQYEVMREIGRGGMGIVYLARDLKLQRLVAVKTLPSHLANDPAIRDRFLREARTAASLSHPNIVPIHRADEMDGHVFFVMGFVDGPALSQLVRDGGPLTPRTAISFLHDVAEALGYAHRNGIVHRDVKAENILVEHATGRALVTDFGIARVAEAAPLTATGTVLGTVYYMSPEQVDGDPVDARSDLYSLGVVAFLALSGRFPFESPTASAVLVAHVTRPAPLLSSVAPTVPSALADVVDRLLQKNPAQRYQSCAELTEALRHVEARLPADDTAAPAPDLPIAISSTEAQEVWRRAAELQNMTGQLPPIRRVSAPDERAPSRAASLTTGYDLEQVRDAAREAGIDEKFVQHALIERGVVPDGGLKGVALRDVSSERNPWLGRSAFTAFEATVPGEMPEREFDVLVDTIRRTLNDAGIVSAIGRSLTWTSADKMRRVQVTVLVRDGRTSIHVSERMRDLAGGIFGGVMGGGSGITIGPSIAIATEVLGHASLIPLFITIGTGLTYTAARLIFRRVAGKRDITLRRLVDQLAEEARSIIARRTVGAARPNDRRLPR